MLVYVIKNVPKVFSSSHFLPILFVINEPIKKDKGIITNRFHNGMNNNPRAAVEELGKTNVSKCIHKSKAKTATAAHKAPYTEFRNINITK